MNRTLGRLRLLIEASAIILTKRRQPRIDAGGRRSRRCRAVASFVSGVRGRRPAREIATREPAPTIPHAIPMSTFWVLKWERWHFNVFSVPKII